MLLLLLACTAATADLPSDEVDFIEITENEAATIAPEVDGEPEPVADPRAAYDAHRAQLAAAREALAARHAAGEDVLDEARAVVLGALSEELFPAWYGTPWEFYGTSQVPGEGSIACGYFVSTLLEHAGFQVERVKMAQQASEYIILSLVPAQTVQRFHGVDVGRVVDAVHAGGDGLYLVGLDYHVGFLLREEGEVRFCHSSYLTPVSVVCEPALGAPALPSRYTVLGKLMQTPMMSSWLEGAPIRTVTRR